MLLCNLRKIAASHYISGTQWNHILKVVQRNEKQTKLKMVYNEQIKMQLHIELQTYMGYDNTNLLMRVVGYSTASSTQADTEKL